MQGRGQQSHGQEYIRRLAHDRVEDHLLDFPAVALLGPRQCGKTTLARELVAQLSAASYLDLEKPSDRRKLEDPELYFRTQRSEREDVLFCLDEIQRMPELFPVLRSLIDENGRNGQFLILGSASRDLIRQTSESLAGRIVFLELTPLLASEVEARDLPALTKLWLRGGFPRSFLARSDESSYRWRRSFVRTFLERDIPQLGFRIPAESLRRLWRMLAHHHGQLVNTSALGTSLGVSHTTVRSYLELLSQTFMVRLLEPMETNVKKRLVKSPKVYLRDCGVLHTLLEIEDTDTLLGHPVYGPSWEGLAIENVLGSFPNWQANFYRTVSGAEIDLILSRGARRLAIECKASTSPTASRGLQNALDDLELDQAWILAPVDETYPLDERVRVAPLTEFLGQHA